MTNDENFDFTGDFVPTNKNPLQTPSQPLQQPAAQEFKLDFAPLEEPSPPPIVQQQQTIANTPEKPMPAAQNPNKTALSWEQIKPYKNLLITCVVVLMAIIAVMMQSKGEPSLKELEEQIQSENASEALKLVYEKGEEGIPLLISALNYSRTRTKARAYLSKYGDEITDDLVNVISDQSGEFNNDARISALRILSQTNATKAETMAKKVIARKDPKLKQAAIEILIDIAPKYKKSYHQMNDKWMDSATLEKEGYIQTQAGWVTSKEAMASAIITVKEGKIALSELSSQDFSYGKLPGKEKLLSLWEKSFSKLHKGVHLANDFIAKYPSHSAVQQNSNRVKKHAIATMDECLQLGIEHGKIFEQKQKLILAISVYATLQKNLSQVNTWNISQEFIPQSFIESKGKLFERFSALKKQAGIPMVLKFDMSKEKHLKERRLQLMEKISFRLQLQGKIADFVENAPDARNWFHCTYKEQAWGTYQLPTTNVADFGETVNKYRILCIISYWKQGDSSPIWQDVVTSSPYLNLPKVEPRKTLENRIYQQALSHFWQRFDLWNPDFKRKRKKIVKQKVKGSTFARQKAVDMIKLKDGKILKGVIKQENKRAISFVVFKQSNRGQTMYANKYISKSKIAKIRRMSKKNRQFKLNMIKHHKTQQRTEEKKIKTMELRSVRWDLPGGGSGWEYKSRFFILYSNTPIEFAREIAFRSERIFDAYEGYFRPQRKQNKKIKIYVFDSMRQYYSYQRTLFGYSVQNPAFYAHGDKLNHIVAGCDLTQYRKEIAAVTRHHGNIKNQIITIEASIANDRASVKKQKRDIIDSLDRQLRAGKIKEYQYNEALRSLRRQMDVINRSINSQLTQLSDLKDQIRRLNYQNLKLIDSYIDNMISTMYHEAFHAFLNNFLFAKTQTDFVPRWLNEGMAQFFENTFFSGREMIVGKMKKNHVEALKKFNREGKLIGLSAFLNNKGNPFAVHSQEDMERSHIYYFQSWALVHFLSTRYNLREGNFFRSYLQDIWLGKDSIEAFENLVQMPIEKFEKKWHKWLKKYK